MEGITRATGRKSAVHLVLLQIYIVLKEYPAPLYWLDLPRDTAFLTEEKHAGIYRDGEEHKRLPTSTTKISLPPNQSSFLD